MDGIDGEDDGRQGRLSTVRRRYFGSHGRAPAVRIRRTEHETGEGRFGEKYLGQQSSGAAAARRILAGTRRRRGAGTWAGIGMGPSPSEMAEGADYVLCLRAAEDGWAGKVLRRK